MRKYFLIILISLTIAELSAQNCWKKNSSFAPGEQIDYKIYYYLGGIWISAGEVYFKTDTMRFGQDLYWYFDSYGQTYPKYDWIYKVRDHYQAYTHYEKLQPSIFRRKVEEGSSYLWENYSFNYRENLVFTKIQKEREGSYVLDTISINTCSYDVLTMIYYARNIDFSKIEVGDKVPIHLFIDNEAHNSYIRYLGKQKKKIKGIGQVDCIVFSPYLIEGSIFNAGEDMTVYVSDDENKIPLLIETPILVGNIRAVVKGIKGLRHPSLIKID